MKNLPEIKILIIGDRGAGRTLLACKLTGLNSKGNGGIEIYETNINILGETYKLLVWDFSEKEILHATHQLFFTSNALYILIDNTRENDEKYIQDEKFQYWFNVVKNYGQQSPLLIVQNEVAGRSKSIEDLLAIQGNYPFVKGILSADLSQNTQTTNDVIQKILEKSRGVAQQFDAFNLEEFRQSIQHHVQGKTNYLSLDEFKKICDNHSSHNNYDFKKNLKKLHNMGVVFNFETHEKVKDLVIFDRNWLLQSVYSILESPLVTERDGVYSLLDVKHILSKPEFDRKHESIAYLMESFSLSYKVKKNEWVATHLFKGAPTKLEDWDNTKRRRMYAQFVFLPKGVVEQLLVESYEQIRLLEPWVGGFFFALLDTHVVVRENWISKQIEFQFRGDNISVIMGLINKNLEKVSKRHSISFDLMLPCTCDECISSNNPTYYSYKKNLLDPNNKKGTIECSASYEKVGTKKIIDDNISDPDENRSLKISTLLLKLKRSFTMNKYHYSLVALIILILYAIWYMKCAPNNSRTEIGPLKVEKEDSGATGHTTSSNFDLTGLININGKPAGTGIVKKVRFQHAPKYESRISDGLYSIEDIPIPPNTHTLRLEVVLWNDSSLIAFLPFKDNPNPGTEITLQEALLEVDGPLDSQNRPKKLKQNNNQYNQVLNILGNDNQVIQSQGTSLNSVSKGTLRKDSTNKK